MRNHIYSLTMMSMARGGFSQQLGSMVLFDPLFIAGGCRRISLHKQQQLVPLVSLVSTDAACVKFALRTLLFSPSVQMKRPETFHGGILSVPRKKKHLLQPLDPPPSPTPPCRHRLLNKWRKEKTWSSFELVSVCLLLVFTETFIFKEQRIYGRALEMFFKMFHLA